MRVAIAGVGGVGAHILKHAIKSGRHEVVVLSRSNLENDQNSINLFPRAQDRHFEGAATKVIDYSDEAGLVEALRGVHTCISAVNAYDEEEQVRSQLALVNACLSAGVRRFAPPEFEGPPAFRGSRISFFRAKNRILQYLEANVPREKLEWCVFVSGGFLDYFTRGVESSGSLMDLGFPVVLDVEKKVAEVPAGPNADFRFSLIRADDLGLYVARALDLETWPKELRAFATRATVPELVALAERATGEKFEQTRMKSVKEAEAERKEAEKNGDFLGQFKAVLPISLQLNEWDSEMPRAVIESGESLLLNDLFPDVKPVDFESFLRRWWGKEGVYSK